MTRMRLFPIISLVLIWPMLAGAGAVTFGGATIGTATIGGTTAAANVTNGLVGWWKFDGGTSGSISNGTTVGFEDSSGSGNNGTAKNSNGTGMAWTTGQISGAVSFDGVDDYVRIPSGFANTIVGNNNHSVSSWFKANSFGQTVLLGADIPEYYLQFNGTTGFYVQVGAVYRTYTLLSSLTTGQWHHVVFVKTGVGDLGNLYIDGVLQTSYTGSIASTPSNSVDFLIGRYTSSGYEFNGLIDDVRIYNRALTTNEITTIYNYR